MIFLNQHNANKPLHAHLQQGVEGVPGSALFLNRAAIAVFSLAQNAPLHKAN